MHMRYEDVHHKDHFEGGSQSGRQNDLFNLTAASLLSLFGVCSVGPCRVAMGDLPGGPVVKTLPSSGRGVGWIPGQGAKILHAFWPKKSKSIKQK